MPKPFPPPDASIQVINAWHRSRNAGLWPGERPRREISPGTGSSTAVLTTALPTLKPLLAPLEEALRHSATGLLLLDGQGRLCHWGGDDALGERFHDWALGVGHGWQEARLGANALGSALIDRQPAFFRPEDHYLELLRDFTAFALPLPLPATREWAVLALISEHPFSPAHGFAMLTPAAIALENRLLEHHPQASLRLYAGEDPAQLDSPQQGIALFDRQGSLLACNRRLENLLGPFGLGKGGLKEWTGYTPEELLRTSQHSPAGIQVGRPPAPRLYVRGVATGPAGDVASGPALAPPINDLATLDLGDPRMAEAIRRAQRIAHHGIPLLIQGETGTGKEVFALAFHQSGPRRDAPFVAINCAAIPATLIESELFGYQEGAFTGARKTGAPGRLREADGGTIFLDEIGDMPLQLQAVLLRVLETRQVPPLGGGQEEPVDISVVCASHRPLRELVDQGRFRADLLFRLSGMTVTLPPLRERSDFSALARRILAEESNHRRITLAASALQQLRKMSWPGNIRQLRNVLRLALAELGQDDQELTVRHLAEELMDDHLLLSGSSSRSSLRANACKLVKEAVARHGGNISAAARELGITRTTLYRKLRQTDPGDGGTAPLA